MRRILLFLIGLSALLATGCSREAEKRAPLVLAAASLQEAMTEAAESWASKGHERPIISFAASSALARQIENGARADLFVSADQEWMDRIERLGRAQAGTRRDLVGNSLVLVAPSARSGPVALEAAALSSALAGGRLAMADPDSVPAGRYGKSALTSLGLWDAFAARIAPAENVRAALVLVERGEAPLGIVYETDARASPGVRVVAAFPSASHPPIVYPIALLSDAGDDAESFYRFLLSDEGQALFARHGFGRPASADADRG